MLVVVVFTILKGFLPWAVTTMFTLHCTFLDTAQNRLKWGPFYCHL
jgi:hypothetical protein